MAEAFGIVAGGLTVLELTAKVIKQCKSLVETAHDAPRDLRHIMVEVSALKGVLESFDFLSRAEYSDAANKLKDPGGLVDECRGTVEEISQELDHLTLANNAQATLGKRKRFQWCMKEEKTRKLLDETVKHKTTLTLALLGEITTDVKEINANVKHMKSKVEETNSDVKQVENRLSDKEQRDICDWIEHTNPTAIHGRARKNYEKDTCKWIHRVDQWNDWLQLQRRTIWVHGIPGAGKTVLASYLIEEAIAHCKRQNNSNSAAALYYYCSFVHGQSERRDEALPCLRWIVSQLCRRNKYIPSALVDLHQSNSAPTYNTLMEALRNHLAQLDVLYVLVDGVDESSPREDLLELIRDLATKPEYDKIQLLVTSRRYVDIESVLRPLSEPTLPMSNSIVDEDIRTYVEASLHQIAHFRRWPHVLMRDIVKRLVEGAQGMFRWAVCQIDRLQRKSPQQAKEAIKNLPETIEDTYETIFLEIHEDDRIRAKEALEWINGITGTELIGGMHGNCLISALDQSQPLIPPPAPCNECYEHDCLKAILGCLVEVTDYHETEPCRFDPFGSFVGDHERPDTLCGHEFTLAHYTIAEFLFSKRLTKSRASYMAMSRDQCTETILKVACQTTTCVKRPSQEAQLYPRFQDFCISIIHVAPFEWPSVLDNYHCLWRKNYELFARYAQSETWDAIRLTYDNSKDFTFKNGPSEDPVVLKMQYALHLAQTCCTSKFEEVLGILSAKTMLTVPVAVFAGDTYGLEYDLIQWEKKDYPTFLGALTVVAVKSTWAPLHLLLDILKREADPSLLMQYFLQIHDQHDKICSKEECIILKLFQAGANVNTLDFAHSPLQIAVHYRDYEGIRLLLKNGANPNGIGRQGGYTLAGVNGAWSRSSPLHILRHAGYAISWAANAIAKGPTVDQEKKTFELIEELLLQHGARDFAVPSTSDSRPQTLELQYLLN